MAERRRCFRAKEGHIMEPLEGLKLGCYSWVEEECPICGKTAMLTLDGDVISCYDCLP